MKRQLYEKYDGGEVTETMLQEAAALFSENYGVWGAQAAQAIGKFAKEGKCITTASCPPSDCSQVAASA